MITNAEYQLDNFLNSMENYSLISECGFTIKNKYKGLSKLISDYRKKIEKAAEKHPFDELTSITDIDELLVLTVNHWDDQSYSQNISLPGGDHYTITWSIPRAERIIEENKVELINYFVKTIVHGIAPGAVNPAYLKKMSTNNEPIIMIDYPVMESRLVVIDGNHRLASRIQSGEDLIPGYILSPKLQYEALAGELDRTLYKVHYNLNSIVNYIVGNFSKAELNKALLPF